MRGQGENRSALARHAMPLALACLWLGACRSLPEADTSPAPPAAAAGALRSAQQWAQQAARQPPDRAGLRAWLLCAGDAYAALHAIDDDIATAAASLSTHCTQQFLAGATARQSSGWSSGRTRIANVEVHVQFRDLSPYLRPPLQLELAQRVSMAAYGGDRYSREGLGVPLAVVGPRCEDAAICQLLPPEGVFRGATAWIESTPDDAVMRLVLADPLAVQSLQAGTRQFPLAYDLSAPYARGIQTSKLHRLAIWGLLGGQEVGRRAGLYLLEDYDPDKRPLVMIHGLGSSPLTWARLTNAVWGSPDLRANYQVWHVVYQTNAPLLVTRRRVQGYLDEAWSVLDPEGDDPARSRMVLVGHSLGGVIARMLCVETGDTLWNAAFLAPPEALAADAADRDVVESVFRFQPYPGVSRAIFIAAPHRGSPTATRWLGRIARVLVGRRAPEMQSLRRIAQDNPDAIRPELRKLYQRGSVNSISTLQGPQPVRLAGEALVPVATIPYHTIAGSLAANAGSDGVVPVESALLAGAESTLVVPSGHNVHESPLAVAEVLRILGEGGSR